MQVSNTGTVSNDIEDICLFVCVLDKISLLVGFKNSILTSGVLELSVIIKWYHIGKILKKKSRH
jgi:hypothetical protein